MVEERSLEAPRRVRAASRGSPTRGRSHPGVTSGPPGRSSAGEEVVGRDLNIGESYQREPLAMTQDRLFSVAARLGLRVAQDLDAVRAEVHDPVLGDACRSVERAFGETVLREG